MAFGIGDRAAETSSTTGTGDFTVGGAVDSTFDLFGDVLDDGEQFYYLIEDGTDVEVGKGTWDAGTSTFSRDTVYFSTNSDALVNWGSGTKECRITIAAQWWKSPEFYVSSGGIRMTVETAAGGTSDAFTQYKTSAGSWSIGQDSNGHSSATGSLVIARSSTLATNVWVHFIGDESKVHWHTPQEIDGQLTVNAGLVDLIGDVDEAVYQATSYGVVLNPIFRGRQSRGSESSPSAINSGDFLVVLEGYGHDGSGFDRGAYLQFAASQAWTTSAQGTRFEVWLNKDGTASPVEAMIIDNYVITLGQEATGSPNASTIRGEVSSGTNISGADLTIAPGNGTGTGGSGSVAIQFAPAGASGSTANTLADVLVVNGQGSTQLLYDGSTYADVQVPSSGGMTVSLTGGTQGFAVGGNAVTEGINSVSVGTAKNVFWGEPSAGSGKFQVREDGSSDFLLAMSDSSGTQTVRFYSNGSSYLSGGHFSIGTSSAASGGSNTLSIADNGSQPTPPSNAATFYGYDSGSGTTEGWVADEAGNDTQLSAHPPLELFSEVTPPITIDPDDPNPSAFRSRNRFIGWEEVKYTSRNGETQVGGRWVDEIDDWDEDQQEKVAKSERAIEAWEQERDAREAEHSQALQDFQNGLISERPQKPVHPARPERHIAKPKPERIVRGLEIRARLKP